MISSDIREHNWLENICEHTCAIVVMEGVSMYLGFEAIQKLIENLSSHFEKFSLLMDCYTSFGAKMSERRNPVNDVGVNTVYGIDDPLSLESGDVIYLKEHDMTPKKYINELKGLEKIIFSRFYAGGISKKIYRMFEYKKLENNSINH